MVTPNSTKDKNNTTSSSKNGTPSSSKQAICGGWLRHVLAGGLLSLFFLLVFLFYPYPTPFDGFLSAQADFTKDLYAGKSYPLSSSAYDSYANTDDPSTQRAGARHTSKKHANSQGSSAEGENFEEFFGGGGGSFSFPDLDGDEEEFDGASEIHLAAFSAPSAAPSGCPSAAPSSAPSGVMYNVASQTTEGAADDTFDSQPENIFKRTSEEPVSTFSVDVDTASYSFTRRMLQHYSRFPQPEMVKIEEMINYFDYDYPAPQDPQTPFASTVMVSNSPWNQGRKLMHIGIKGYDVVSDNKDDQSRRPFSNLVFLVDVSGSMESSDKLPLAKKSIEMLLSTLMPGDYVSIVTYASGAKVVLDPTPVAQKNVILGKLNSLRAGGATWGTGGIEMAYKVAEENFDADAVNRIILVTDGDFNVGLVGPEELKQYIEKKRETGVFLSVLGFGMGNYRDTTMKALANHGNGVAAYIDSIEEAHKVMVTEAQSTIFPIAKDVKIQIEFNPATVAEYRLVGYEKRLLQRQDFNNDKVDAGDIGAGHTVTAIYEFTPVGSEDSAAVDELRYASEKRELVEGEEGARADTNDAHGQEYAFLKMRFKLPDEDTSKLISMPITDHNDVENMTMLESDMAKQQVRQEFQFASAVAGFAQLLKGSKNIGKWSCEDVLALAEGNLGEDRFGYRREFVQLVLTAKRVAEAKIY